MHLDKELLYKIFEETDKELRQKGLIGEIVLFGGAAMIFAFDARRFTKDLDAYLRPQEEVLSPAIFRLKHVFVDPESFCYPPKKP